MVTGTPLYCKVVKFYDLFFGRIFKNSIPAAEKFDEKFKLLHIIINEEDQDRN